MKSANRWAGGSMPKFARLEEVQAMAGALGPSLIAIDGLPCAGKSTLATQVSRTHGYDRIGVDDFLLPESQWPSRRAPAFPFEFMRYDAMMEAVRSLATTGACIYTPFDWATLSVSSQKRTVNL